MSKSIQVQNYRSPFGELIIGSFEGELCLCDWRYRKMRSTIDSRIQKGLEATYEEGNSTCISNTMDQIEAYAKGELMQFDIPMRWVGTPFQKTVWNELLNIPFGETSNYLELSRALGDEKAIRAVASANGANAISIIVPCHRVIGKDGSLVGYAGGIETKRKLLELEGASPNGQLSIFN